MKRFIQTMSRNGLFILGMMALVSVPLLVSATASAANSNITQAQNGVDAIGGNKAGNGGAAFTNLLENIINLLLFIIGAIAVIMIIIGGIRYVTSNGDSNQTKSARDTILYSIVGLVVAIMAYALVGFVLNSLK